MRAEKYLHEKALSHLKRIDLENEAVELKVLQENLQEDLPYYLLNLDTRNCYFSEELRIAKSMTEMVYTNGALFRTKKEGIRLRKSYKEFIEANKEVISRDLACVLSPLNISKLKIRNDDSRWPTLYERKMVHKAWAEATWKGKTFGNDFYKFADEFYSGVKIKKNKYVDIQVSTEGLFSQRDNGMYLLSESRKTHNVHMLKVFLRELEILKIGLGNFQFNTNILPIFVPEMKDENHVYVVAKDSENRKYLMLFPNIEVCSLQKELNITKWEAHSIWATSGVLNFVLEGKNQEGKTLAKIFGTPPVIYPRPNK